MSAQSLAGARVALIGGTSGIGLGVAAALIADGASVVVGSSQQAGVDAAVASLGAGASGHVVDVSDEASVAAFFKSVGAFDHLVYSAGDWGQMAPAPVGALDLAAAHGVFTVRFWGALAAVKHALPTLSSSGSITLTTGMLAHRPRKGAAVSSAMLGAIEHLARALALDLAPVRVNAICPGLILTDRNARLPEAFVQAYVGRQPLPRCGATEELAQAYLYLMRGGYTTGQVLRIEGGGSVV